MCQRTHGDDEEGQLLTVLDTMQIAYAPEEDKRISLLSCCMKVESGLVKL